MIRVALGAMLAVSIGACAPGSSARSPECNARVNRCMESCGNTPEVTSPREQTMATPERTHTPQDPCTQRCNSMCR